MQLHQVKTSLADPIRRFLAEQIQPVKDEAKHYHTLSDRLDHTRNKYAACSPAKPSECEENLNMLRASKHGFNHTAVNYVRALRIFKQRHCIDLLEKLLAYMASQVTFFEQSGDTMRDFRPILQDIVVQVSRARTVAPEKQKKKGGE